ncbi:ATP-binding cassette domain-containing protein [Arthrobacter agilis]|uniref:ABC transporter ATP-binding protein n=1 Tax=Arthrobacter agilis TaxID=37921 RepID=UPI00236734A8|nr:ABC transporter ATP-binding protein [Arthrobacter agilis]WDF33889.1 ATP-binding cassette domain-containing protein [Arthrobacter agilis]
MRSESFTYDDGVPLLSGVQLAVGAGEYVVVAGASGSGKTTLARLLAGLVGSDAGCRFRGSITLAGETVRFDGTPADPRIDRAAWSAAVAFVAQGAWGQLSMMSATVAEEIAFGPSNRGVPTEELRRSVHEVAASLRLTSLLGRDPRRLSGGQLQRTVIAAAVVQRPRVLVLDEPFQGLDEDSAAEVAAALDALRGAGTAVVVCDAMLPRSGPADARVLALAEGHPVFSGLLTEARWAGLRRYGIGTAGDPPGLPDGLGSHPDDGEPTDHAGVRPQDSPTGAGAATPSPLVLTDVGFRHPTGAGESAPTSDTRSDTGSAGAGLSGITLTVRAGEIVAVRGPNGSGKTTLLQHLNGLHRADTGTVSVLGQQIRRQPTGTLAGDVGYLFQDTDQQLFERTVLREVAYGPLAAGVRRSEALRRAADALDVVGLGFVRELHPYELGFVQRRLVALASIIATGSTVWVLDEPTGGLDESARTGLARLLRRHARSGGAVVMATHDAAFATAVAHRTIWLDGGRLVPVDPGTDGRTDSGGGAR